MTEKTCKELVAAELKKEIETLSVLWQEYQDGIEDSENGSIFDHGLSFDYVAPGTFTGQRKGYFRYQISWGGPSDEFRIFATPNNRYNFEVSKIEYWYLDWFDGAKKKLTGKNLELLSEIFHSFFVDGGSATTEYEKSMSEEF